MLLAKMELFSCAAGLFAVLHVEGRSTCCNPNHVSLVQLYKKLNMTWTQTVVVTTLTQMGAIVTTVKSALEMITHIHLVLISTLIIFMNVIGLVRCLECISSHKGCLAKMGLMDMDIYK